jgi:hypothetical protein
LSLEVAALVKSNRFVFGCIVAALACSAAVARLGVAQTTAALNCANLETDARDRFRYMQREGRCEGLYIRKNSGGASLVLLSLTEQPAPQSPGTPNRMQLAWPSKTPVGVSFAQLSIRAAADPGGRHYQMDVTKPFASGAFMWPLDVLKGAGIPDSVVHLVGFTRTKVGSTTSQLLYAPLRRGNRQGGATAYDFTIEPSADVDDLTYTIQTLNGDAWSSTTAAKSPSFGTGAAKRPFTVSVPRSEFAGMPSVHRVNFAAKLGERSDPEPANCIVVFFND